ncbi:class I SAM-dependent methyltransferase [Pseudonocardia alni]|uniref:O-methyltransferase YrrM n=1 Tax=Pseudonocardia alni TaxID=33907 RepID=A0A852WC81_PSEA5|nr:MULTISPECIES: class I SAM-dependent methyltransferase [Pseudonocardia]MCO7196490.1 class I SAM-dependent methyltransferase [Pseudonocardia sp. McavD-2-B]NYG02992.1 putative O-methyltransferase YrrM [Pseudonocardia antarctica]PKB31468.1 putative O-methyltransferase YrrM [Pseudonocardia alni]
MLEFLAGLYRTHADDLAMVIDRQRELLADGTITPQLDDVEAELTYLLLRHHRPSQVVEVGTYYGWSTTWILSALRDNGSGHLQSFDLVDHVCGTVPEELSTGRWTFHRGDLRETVEKVPADTGYLFVDADHGRRFARWYLEHLFGRIATGTPTSVHDVFHLPRARPFTEGSEVLRHLERSGTGWFTSSRAAAPRNLRALDAVRAELGITGVRGTSRNPMIFFSMP